MDWLNFNSKEELQRHYKNKYKKYTMRELKKEIEDDIKSFISEEKIKVKGSSELVKITATSWENLYLKIKLFKNIVAKVSSKNDKTVEVKEIKNNKLNNDKNNNFNIEDKIKKFNCENKKVVNTEIYENDYFKSRGDELIFYILELSGKKRNEKLGVREEHYENKRLADKWRKGILLKIHPDVCKNPKAATALMQFEQLCKVIIR